MGEHARLFCLDTVLIDVVLKIATLPERAGDVLASDTLVTTGGGFNAMSAAARHGMGVVYAGRLGAGPFSTLAATSLEDEGIEAPIEINASLDAGLCVVLSEPDGERSFVTSPGSEETLRAGDLDALDVGPGDYLLVSGYNVMYPELARVVLTWIRALSMDVIVVFDPATRMIDIPPSNRDALLDRANWLVCNASEAVALADTSDVAEAATRLAARNDTLDVVVRTGSEGCLVARNHDLVAAVDGFFSDVVDTNGAGDVHNGVFIAELASGGDALAAARWANAASAMAISVLGPATCPSRADVASWIASRTARSS